MRESKHHSIRRTAIRRQQDSHQRPKSVSQDRHSASNRLDEGQNPRSIGLGAAFGKDTFERHASMLDSVLLSKPMYSQERAALVQQLQKDYGNRYVQRLVDHISRKRSAAVQTKLEVGPAGDAYEQEADKIAKQVVSMTTGSGDPAMQRADDLDDEMQMLPRVQRADDLDDELQTLPNVQRADDLDDELQTLPSIQRADDLDDELPTLPTIQRAEDLDDELPTLPTIQRADDLDDELQTLSKIQRQISAEGGEVDSEIEGAIGQSRGGGQALPDNVRGQMENAFGADFSGVRVHTGAKSDSLNESISSRAFTTGKDIFFNKGEYNPGSSAGKEVLAHELTHVVQQNGSAVQRDEQDISRLADVQRQDDQNVPEEQKEDFLTKQEEQDWLQAKPQIQRAWTGRRQLSGMGVLGKPWIWRKKGNLLNLGLYHEHIFFEDGRNPADIGHMGQQGLGSDAAHGQAEYSRVREDLDDARIRTAVHLMGDPGPYTLLSNNCQAYVQDVLDIYDKLMASYANVGSGSPELSDE